MQWEYLDDGSIRCKAHGAIFTATTSCDGCAGACAPAPPTVDDATPPPGCITLAEAERRLVATADYASGAGRRYLRSGTWREKAIGVKLLDVAVRSLRGAIELANTRERRAHVRGLRKKLDDAQRTKARMQ